jgi:lysophospholipase L1-like esterase
MKKILFRMIASLLGVILILISTELLFRINPKFGYLSNSFKKVPLSEYKIGIQPSALLGYEHIPNFGDYLYGEVGKINFYGLIGRGYGLHKDKNIFRILVLGDSIAENGWPCLFLENYLNNNALLSRLRYKRFEVWNAGVTSYDVRRYALFLKYKGLKYKPDMVIIFFCLNDFSLNTNIYYQTKEGAEPYYFPIIEISKIYNVNPVLMKKSYLYRFIILRLESYLLSKKNLAGVSREEETGRYYLQMIKEICKTRNIPLFAVVFPYLMPLNKYSSGAIGEYQTICRASKELQINYLNLYEYLSKKDLYSLRRFKEDYIHLNPKGYHFAAKVIYEYLLDNFFKNQ